ncbi:AraC family transcriptional regulator [Anoxybacterium hadale]|uniref:AraC family transcriptional regulator n=1 Tax=Anoxybacterium hadale TaxID=3408580 RepID=A0ACD1A6Q4_9FIRM|nr:AraC family transcriptional regulator [Clostridiales bacterium]
MKSTIVPANYIPFQPGFEQKIHYRNFVVPADHPLHGLVADFYQFDSISAEGELCVIPDGCIDLLFRYGGCRVVMTVEGYHMKKVLIPIDQIGCAFGVRLAPGGLSNFTRIKTWELVGKQLPLTDVLEDSPILERMDLAAAFEERIAIVTEYLVRQLRKCLDSAGIVRFCTERVIHCRGHLPISELSRETGYSVRYLRNLYQRHVGISPKEFCEIIQLQTSILQYTLLMKQNQRVALSDLAIQFGYYDQSHMNKCYQKLVGSLPQKFYYEIQR